MLTGLVGARAPHVGGAVDQKGGVQPKHQGKGHGPGHGGDAPQVVVGEQGLDDVHRGEEGRLQDAAGVAVGFMDVLFRV